MKCSLLLLFILSFLVDANAQQPAIGGRVSTAEKDSSSAVQSDTSSLTSSSGLSAEVKYSAEDSIRFDRQNNVVHLYGQSRIAYEEFELIADYIRLDQKNNLLFAKGKNDSKTNRYKGRPIFTQSSEPPVTTDSLVFNFKTKKGKTFGTFSDVEGGYIQAGQSKKNQYNEISLKNAIYSTCNLPHPHFGIHITRGIVTEKQIVTGPAYLEIEDIPFPIGVPFGFFPKANKRASGILFPTFGEEQQRGFFLREFGYYIGLNDYWDAEVRGSVYSKGSYEGRLAARYRKNYKHDGSLNFRYALTKAGIEGLQSKNKDFNLQWSHSQRQEANPGTTFSASVNLGTSSYFSNTAAGGSYDPSQVTRNNMNSSIAYGKTFADGRVNFTSSLRHQQDITAGTVDLTLPDFNLGVSTFNPFDSKNRAGEQKWFQRIAVGYTLQGTNSISTSESDLFKKGTLDQFNTGFQHNIPVSLSLNVLKYLQFSSGVQYTERWYLQTIRKEAVDRPSTGVRDSVAETINQGFSRAYDYSLSTGLSTKVYGMMNFKKGNLVALRHVMTPSVSFSYRPDFSSERFGYYRTISGITGATDNTQRYSIYENAIFGGPGAGESAAIGFSLDNNLEAKVKSKNDTSSAFKKVPIIQGLSFNGSYNFVATEFKLSQISFGGRTSLFNQKVGINLNGAFDPYQLNEAGQRINRYAISNGKLARLTNLGLSFDFSLNSSALKERNQNVEDQQNKTNLTPQQKQDLERISRDPYAFVDFNVPWNITASYSFQYSKPLLESNITNTLNFSGDFSVTPKWKIQYSSGYDFKVNKVSYTQFSIYRDLHCWDLNFNVIPFGPYRSYSVDLRVRASILQDLKLSKRRSYFDNNF